MDVHLSHEADHDEFLTMERCRILENWNSPDDPDVSIARATLDSGAATELHLLDVAERWLVVAGAGQAEIGPGNVMPIAVGDVVVIPPGTPQRVVNDGGVPLVFYCICTPRFRPTSYTALTQQDEPANP